MEESDLQQLLRIDNNMAHGYDQDFQTWSFPGRAHGQGQTKPEGTWFALILRRYGLQITQFRRWGSGPCYSVKKRVTAHSFAIRRKRWN